MPGRERLVRDRGRGAGRWVSMRLGLRRPRRVRLSFHTQPLADYLFYGLYRTDRHGLDVPLDLSLIPPAECCGHFPQFVAHRGTKSPAALPALVEEYSREELARYDLPLAELRPRILALRCGYEEYLPFWHERVLPLESQLLDAWREQASGSAVMDLFQRVTRLRWPFSVVRLFACYHHPSGSALTPYPCLFSTLFDRYAVEPSVAWFLGHEGMHLLLDAVGWWEHPEAPAGIRWVGGRHLAEEALCLVFQNRLATICGVLPEAEMQVLPGGARHLRLYRWLQAHWDEYLMDAERFPTVVEFLVTGLRETREESRKRRQSDEREAETARRA